MSAIKEELKYLGELKKESLELKFERDKLSERVSELESIMRKSGGLLEKNRKELIDVETGLDDIRNKVLRRVRKRVEKESEIERKNRVFYETNKKSFKARVSILESLIMTNINFDDVKSTLSLEPPKEYAPSYFLDSSKIYVEDIHVQWGAKKGTLNNIDVYFMNVINAGVYYREEFGKGGIRQGYFIKDYNNFLYFLDLDGRGLPVIVLYFDTATGILKDYDLAFVRYALQPKTYDESNDRADEEVAHKKECEKSKGVSPINFECVKLDASDFETLTRVSDGFRILPRYLFYDLEVEVITSNNSIDPDVYAEELGLNLNSALIHEQYGVLKSYVNVANKCQEKGCTCGWRKYFYFFKTFQCMSGIIDSNGFIDRKYSYRSRLIMH